MSDQDSKADESLSTDDLDNVSGGNAGLPHPDFMTPGNPGFMTPGSPGFRSTPFSNAIPEPPAQ